MNFCCEHEYVTYLDGVTRCARCGSLKHVETVARPETTFESPPQLVGKPDFEKMAKEMMQSNETPLDKDTASINSCVLKRLEIRFYKVGMKKIWNDYVIPLQEEKAAEIRLSKASDANLRATIADLYTSLNNLQEENRLLRERIANLETKE